MRNATAYGASPRQRFDLVLNNLCGFAHTIGEIRMTSDGSPWRPITHIEDICEAMLCALTAPKEAVAGEAFNVGADSENYRIREIAEIVAATFPGCALTVGDSRRRHPQLPRLLRQDPRAHAGVPHPLDRRARRAASSAPVFERIGLTREMFEAPPFTRLKELKFLRDTDQIDAALYWTRMAPVPEALQDGDRLMTFTRRRLLASLLSAAAVLPLAAAPPRPGGACARGCARTSTW